MEAHRFPDISPELARELGFLAARQRGFRQDANVLTGLNVKLRDEQRETTCLGWSIELLPLCPGTRPRGPVVAGTIRFSAALGPYFD